MSANSVTANGIVLSGLLLTGSTGANTISQNVVHSLSNNSGAASNSIYAIYTSFSAVAGNVVERNLVHSLSITSSATTSQLVGILPVAGNGTYQNNMVRLGYDAAGNSITSGIVIYGMFEIAGANNIYNNSVYVGGTGVVSSSNTFAFVSNVTTGTRNYIDNIFWNARSNASGTATNTAGALSAATGATSNFNDLFADGVGGVAGPMAVGLDANSIAVDPLFVAPTGTSATVNLHLLAGSPAMGAGTPIATVTDDFDGDPRSATTPSIGADE
jgi:trimeric autotransporter adhesin